MRVLAMPRSVAWADIVMRTIVETNFAPNQTVRDLRDVVEKGARSKCRAMSISLWQFASACSPFGQSAMPACARTVSSSVEIVISPTRLRSRHAGVFPDYSAPIV
jgi:hypothetical protein